MAESIEDFKLLRKSSLPTARKVKEKKVTVQGTNDNSIVSKFSMVTNGYFDDQFLQFFVKKKVRRSPLINRGYYVRAKVMEFIIEKFLVDYCEGCIQIISLGAGFDTTFFRLSSRGLLENVKYIEVDLPGVVKRKTQIIESNKELYNIVGPFKKIVNGIFSSSYALVACDITEIEKLEKICKFENLQQNVPTLVMSEVVLAYIENESASKLISWVRKFFVNSVFTLYEQIHPEDSFGQIMLKHFKTLQSPLQCINSYPDTDSQIRRFKLLGWPEAVAIDMNEFFQRFISDDEKCRIGRLEPFDEFEEWHLKCAHYVAVTAFVGICESLKQKLFPGRFGTENIVKYTKENWLCLMEKETRFQRYGHRLTGLTNELILVTGGFGVNFSRHERLSNGILINCKSDHHGNAHFKSLSLLQAPRMFHSATSLRDGLVFIFGGRASPIKPCIDYYILKYDIGIQDQLETEVSSLNDITDRFGFVTLWNGSLILNQIEEQREDEKKPSPRWRHTATAVNIQGEECVLVIGGRSDKLLALSDVWIFNVINVSWKQGLIEGETMKARSSHAASIWNDNLVITGGIDERLQPLNIVQRLHYKNSPMRLETINFTQPLPARYSHSQHLINNNLWIVGGVSLKISSSLIAVDLEKLVWKEYSLPKGSDPCNPVMLHNHASVILKENEILVVGGGGNCFSFGTHFNKGLLLTKLPKCNFKD